MNAIEALSFAKELLEAYGLTDWRVGLDRSRRRFGRCNYLRKEITLSLALVELNNQAEVLDTILHEIAHAIAGPEAGHREAWKKVARSLGCSAERCYSAVRTALPPPRLVLECPRCGAVIHRERMPRRRIACGTCCARYSGGRFDPQFLMRRREGAPGSAASRSRE